MTPKKRAEKLLIMAPVNWRAVIEKHQRESGTWQEVSQYLDALIQKAAFLREYVDCRAGNYGTGWREHDDAVKEARKTTIKVRRALGFAYPDNGVLSI